MDFEIQTICVVRPLYFTVAVLLLFSAAVASAISLLIATYRRARRQNVVSPHIDLFHQAVLIVWLTYASVLVVGFVRDANALRDYQRTGRNVSPAVRAAMKREQNAVIAFGAGCAVSGVLSMLAWRGVPRSQHHSRSSPN
jgi:hypothetical protein